MQKKKILRKKRKVQSIPVQSIPVQSSPFQSIPVQCSPLNPDAHLKALFCPFLRIRGLQPQATPHPTIKSPRKGPEAGCDMITPGSEVDTCILQQYEEQLSGLKAELTRSDSYSALTLGCNNSSRACAMFTCIHAIK